MVQVSYPGVYIVEKPSGVRTITGVATSVAAFVGYTRRGLPNKAVPVTSFADFERSHGGLDRDSPLSYAVRQFFLNGGTQALIVRVATGFATTSWILNGGNPAAPVLDVTAASPGAWSNDLRLTVQRAEARNPESEFNLVVSRALPTPQVLEVHRNLTLDSKSPLFAESVINSASSLINVKRRAGLTFGTRGIAVSTPLTLPLKSPTPATIGGTIDGTTPFVLTVAASPVAGWAAVSDVVTAVNAAITAAGLQTQLQASATDANGGTTAPLNCLTLTSLTTPNNQSESSKVVVASGTLGSLVASMHLGLANGGKEITGAALHRPVVAADVAPAAPGLDGTPGGANDLIGSPAAKTGMNALLDVDLFNLLLIPETFSLGDTDTFNVVAAGIALCEARRAFYIVDAPSNRTLNDPTTGIAKWTADTLLGTAARNAAVYWPPVRISDPLDGLRPRAMAPSGTIAGIYARTDAQRGVWKAPAGTDATLNGVIDLNQPVNDIENGQLNPAGVNVLRSFPAYGRVVWGARTGRGSDSQGDEYKYVPIRRLALFLEESLYRGTQWVVFEPNDEPLWAQIRLNLGAFMNGLFRQGAFQGKTPQEAYFVKCDKETTTQADRNLGIVNILVGFAPLKPAEFVVITIQQIAGDLQ